MEHIPSLIIHKKSGVMLDPAHDWVLSGNGKATQMYDGRGYAVIQGKPYAHYAGFHITEDLLFLGTYNKRFWGWSPVPQDDTLFWTVWNTVYDEELWDWSYELIGPDVNGNPEHYPNHVLIPHGRLIITALEKPTLEGVHDYLRTHDIEGVVWWEDPWDPTCRKVKVQQSDLDLKRRTQ